METNPSDEPSDRVVVSSEILAACFRDRVVCQPDKIMLNKIIRDMFELAPQMSDNFVQVSVLIGNQRINQSQWVGLRMKEGQ